MAANDYLDGFIVEPEAMHEGLLAKPVSSAVTTMCGG